MPKQAITLPQSQFDFGAFTLEVFMSEKKYEDRVSLLNGVHSTALFFV